SSTLIGTFYHTLCPHSLWLFQRIDLLLLLLFQEEKAIGRGILPLLQRATLVQTFGQKNHVCLKDGSITIPPYAPPQKMQAHLIPPDTPRSIFVYFRGLFYDTSNDPEGGYYAR
ncbi:Os01g0926700, partial [Oryza sativa Japonica Group]